MYPPAHAMAEGRLLVTSMIDEHHVITGLVEAVERADDPVAAAASATALRVMFDSHLAKENELVLPLLTSARDVSVADLLGGMHELLGAAAHDDDARRPPPRRGRRPDDRHRSHLRVRGGRPGRSPRARRAEHPPRHPARHDLRGARCRRPRGRSRARRAPRPGPVAGPGGAAHPRPVRGQLPRAGSRGLASAVPAPRLTHGCPADAVRPRRRRRAAASRRRRTPPRRCGGRGARACGRRRGCPPGSRWSWPASCRPSPRSRWAAPRAWWPA